MKIKSLPMILGLLTFLGFCSLTLVVLPAFSEHFNFSTAQTSNIGSTIGGIMGPLVGVFSAYLLYEALTAQQEGNKAQRIKNDSDIIFMLINQIDKEYDSFSTSTRKSGAPVVLHGFEGLTRFAKRFESEGLDERELLHSNEAVKLLYLLESFELINDRVQNLDLDPNTHFMFATQLKLYYRSKFQYPVDLIIRETKQLRDETLDKFREIHIRNMGYIQT